MRTHEGASRTCGNTAGRDVDGFTLGSTVAGKREQQQQREQRTHRLFRHPGLSNSFFAFRKRSAVRRGGRRKGGEKIGRGDATRGDGQRAAGNGTCRVAVPFVCAHSQLALAGRVRLSGTGTGSSHPWPAMPGLCQDHTDCMAHTGTRAHGSRAAWGRGLGTLLPPTMR